ncbi:myb-like protein W [Penaeus japonicus]|uniref:myb-like protein W n=1 Tax=Penaeus japonicus TaxID=27405 RepID=UPI001C712413|nr:myb-like protein W [Penaeus japonicus]
MLLTNHMLTADTNFNQRSPHAVQMLNEAPFSKLHCLPHIDFVRDFEDQAKKILKDQEEKDNQNDNRTRKKKENRKDDEEPNKRGRSNVNKRVRTRNLSPTEDGARNRVLAGGRTGNDTTFAWRSGIEGIQKPVDGRLRRSGDAASPSRFQRGGRSVATMYSDAERHEEGTENARTFPDVVCRQSNTGLFSFFAFAILSLDLTANIMSTIDISVDIDIAGSAANGTTTVINNTNTNTNTNMNTNMNTNNNGRSLHYFDSYIPLSASKGVEDSAKTLKDEGGTDYVTGEAGYPLQDSFGERNSLKELLEDSYDGFLEAHQRLIMQQGRVHRRGYSQGFLQAWFEVLLDLYYALRE